MTIYGWDASHFDGLLSPATLARAKAEGFAFFTHKLAEGTQDTEGPNDDTALAAARDAGFEFIGGYLIPRSSPSVSAQVDFWLEIADRSEPWWRTFPGWFWQIDLERWSYDNVPASVGVAAAQELRARTGRQVILYASRGMYGDQLAGWDGPLWNADYVSGAGFASSLYPGDGWAPGWAPYSGQAPVILQFTSSATIAGLTTCDANAFRGTADEFRSLITGGAMSTDLATQDPNFGTPIEDIYSAYRLLGHAVVAGEDPIGNLFWLGKASSQPNLLWQLLRRLDTAAAADATRDAAMLAAIQALSTGGTSVDTGAVITAIQTATAATSATVEALHEQLVAAQAELHQLRTQLAKSAQDQAADLGVSPQG